VLTKELSIKQEQLLNLAKENRLQKNLINELKKENHSLYLEVEVQTTEKADLIKQWEAEFEKVKHLLK
jgi:hypothetical protein